MRRFGIGFAGEMPVPEMIKYVRLAEESGFESVWMSEDPNLRDAISPTAAFAAATERIKVGFGIISSYTRNPLVIAMTIATLDELSNKRAFLGLGTGVRSWVEDMGIRFKKPLAAMRECVEIVRRLMTGKPVTYEGSVFRIRNVALAFKPVRDYIPIYLAAVGPKMLELAGEIGDGVLLGATKSPEYIKQAVKRIEAGAKRAGKSLAEIDVASLILSSVDKNSKVAKDAIKPTLANLIGLPAFTDRDYYVNAAQKIGLDSKVLIRVREALKRGDLKAAYENMPDTLIDALSASGTPDEFAERLEEHKEAGETLSVIMPVGNVKMAIQTVKGILK